ncbi:ribosome hibernation-promoting factor, HPF/YfiA family [Chlamydiota bacterium]
MEITVTGRHVNVTEAMKQYAQQKIEKVIRNIPKVINVHIIIDIEKFHHIAEVVILAGNNITIRAKESTEDMYSSIDILASKIERQVKKYKGKLYNHRLRPTKEIAFTENVLSSEEIDDDDGQPRIMTSERFEIKPMFVDEAAMQMDLSSESFKVFLNAQSERVNVIYRRKDGNYGLIEPDF